MEGFVMADDDPENTLVLTLKTGEVKIALRPDLAPLHVARLKELTREGFYDNIAFHRVIPNFMAQTGDPKGTGSGGSKLPNLKAEFSGEPHKRGTLSMARTNDPNSANSQFFICLADCSWLDRQYTVFGKVIEGMEHVDQIKKGGENNNGAIAGQPDRIVKMRVGSD
jgi:cyclophilin family peptidyl-prolyl cis-trans isomerase